MFKDRVVLLRTILKLTQAELADAIGVERSTLSNYEKGRREPDYATLNMFADHFGVSTDFLLGRTNELAPPKGVIVNIAKLNLVDGWEKKGYSIEDIEKIFNTAELFADMVKPKPKGRNRPLDL